MTLRFDVAHLMFAENHEDDFRVFRFWRLSQIRFPSNWETGSNLRLLADLILARFGDRSDY